MAGLFGPQRSQAWADATKQAIRIVPRETDLQVGHANSAERDLLALASWRPSERSSPTDTDMRWGMCLAHSLAEAALSPGIAAWQPWSRLRMRMRLTRANESCLSDVEQRRPSCEARESVVYTTGQEGIRTAGQHEAPNHPHPTAPPCPTLEGAKTTWLACSVAHGSSSHPPFSSIFWPGLTLQPYQAWEMFLPGPPRHGATLLST